ncbi:deoxycytidylate deaminase [Clavulina sp. PMI_390]|nr:deoxycytidylate deaminase [Clavulina sp. PMI_390]
MFIGVVGSACSGKRTAIDYLKREGFIELSIAPSSAQVVPVIPNVQTFPTSNGLLDFVTRNWRENYVSLIAGDEFDLSEISVRPFFLVLRIDAPILLRWRRHHVHASSPPVGVGTPELLVMNNFTTTEELYDRLAQMNLLDPERLRPGWDTYFMTLANLASLRSNCMKRRVGAIIVRNRRIIATGYNGTPRNLTNCNEGGCPRCNGGGNVASGDECLCLHAEENALLEAGRERVGLDSVLYCNTCPCLKCSIKIVQSGVREVVYNLAYKMDDATARVFIEAGVILRQYSPPA